MRARKDPILKYPGRERGFTLLEMLVVMTLLSMIVYGLYRMFDQTQRALRANTTQVDVLEGGRAALEVISREIQQAVTGLSMNNTHWSYSHLFTHPDYRNPLLQRLNDGSLRTNSLYSFFFLTRPAQIWQVNGFFVGSATNGPGNVIYFTNTVDQLGVGTLYHYLKSMEKTPNQFYLGDTNRQYWARNFELSKTKTYRLNSDNVDTPGWFLTNEFTPYPILDGVVHFRVRPYDSWGMEFFTNVYTTNLLGTNLAVSVGQYRPDQRSSYFFSNALPSFVELELGILEPQVYQRMKAFPSLAAQRNFLSNHVSAVHIFRKLIPLRNAQPLRLAQP